MVLRVVLSHFRLGVQIPPPQLTVDGVMKACDPLGVKDWVRFLVYRQIKWGTANVGELGLSVKQMRMLSRFESYVPHNTNDLKAHVEVASRF